jgi:rhodanese-related sulfurtransferase
VARHLASAVLVVGLACGNTTQGVRDVSAQDVLALGSGSDAVLVLDVRSAEEFASGHVPGARNVAYDQVGARLGELGPAREVVVYCESGGRAAKAADLLQSAGFTVLHLAGDMRGWREQELPIER